MLLRNLSAIFDDGIVYQYPSCIAISVDVLKLQTGSHTGMECNTENRMPQTNSSRSCRERKGLGEMTAGCKDQDQLSCKLTTDTKEFC